MVWVFLAQPFASAHALAYAAGAAGDVFRTADRNCVAAAAGAQHVLATALKGPE